MGLEQTYYDFVGFSAPETAVHQALPAVPDLRRVALFVDLDGTLVPELGRPGLTVVDARTRALLAGLHARTGGALAVVSGRRLSELEALLPDFDGILVGSHGAERRDAEGRGLVPGVRRIHMASLIGAVRAMAAHLGDVVVEEKPASIVLHVGGVPARHAVCAAMLNALAGATPGVEVRHGRSTLELIPEGICKGRAMTALLARWPSRTPVAVGDGLSDESMFHVAEARDGYGIKVGEGATAASRHLNSVEDVRAMLEHWLESPAGTPCLAS